MIEVLRNKNLTTKFQILVAIAEGGPDIQQRAIARELEITPQAVSDYIAQLIQEKLLQPFFTPSRRPVFNCARYSRMT